MSIESTVAQNLQTPWTPHMPGISPTPLSPHITHTVIALALWPSTWNRSSTHRELSVLVAAYLLKLSRTFHSNVTCSIWQLVLHLGTTELFLWCVMVDRPRFFWVLGGDLVHGRCNWGFLVQPQWLLVHWFQGAVLFRVYGVLSYVKTLQGLGVLDASIVAVGARVLWFCGSVVQRRA